MSDEGGRRGGDLSRLGLAAALAVSLGLSLYGQGWGLPATKSWSNDDIAPKAPIRAVETWREGWYKYPSLQPLIDHALYAPWLSAWRRSGAIEGSAECLVPDDADCYDDPQARFGWLMRLSRLRSAVMAAGTVLAVWVMALRVGGGSSANTAEVTRAATWAALFAACLQSLVFFAHTGNVDVPQTFWFAWSMVAWIVAMQGGGTRAYVAFGALAAASLATKEAIVGVYVLPGLALVWLSVRRGIDHSIESSVRSRVGRAMNIGRAIFDPRFLVLAAALFGVYGLINNVMFNLDGFKEHVAYWVDGPGIDEWNDDFGGYFALAGLTWRRLGDAMGRPLLWWCAAAAMWAAWRRPGSRVLLLPIVSYTLFTIGAVRYVFTRFTLPMAVVLCVFGGLLAEAAWRERGVRRVVGVGLAGVVLVHSLLYTIHMDRLLVLDARYAAEEWFSAAGLPTGDDSLPVVTLGSSTHQPRLEWLGYDVDRVDEGEFTAVGLAAVGVDVIVLSGKTLDGLDGEAAAFRDSLLAGEAEFGVVFDFIAMSGLERVLVKPYVESRVNPRIVILRRDVEE